MESTHTNSTQTTVERLQREVDLYAAPSAHPDILPQPPRVTRAPDGTLQVQLVNDVGEFGDLVFPVTRVVQLYQHGLVLVGTEGKAFLMHEADYQAHLPKLTAAERRLEDLSDTAEATVVGLMNEVDLDHLPPAARTLAEVANQVYDRNASMDVPTNAPRRRLGYVLMLDALIAAPEAVQQALQGVRDDLVASDPALALVGSVEGRTTPPA